MSYMRFEGSSYVCTIRITIFITLDELYSKEQKRGSGGGGCRVVAVHS